MIDFDAVWRRICDYEGEEFRTVRNLPFTYGVTGNHINTNRTTYNIARSQFEKALSFFPVDGPGELGRRGVHGQPYIYAILTDPRIRQGDW